MIRLIVFLAVIFAPFISICSEWTDLSHRVIFHGRRVCHARKPACGVCVLAQDCPSYGTGPTDPLLAAPLVKGPETEHLLALAGL